MIKLTSFKTKTVLFIAILFCVSVGAKAQGIEFFHGSFEEAKAKAKAENKPLFVDVFTSWCGPCKRLSKEVFTQKAIGDFFNQAFICFKLQTDEKGTKNQEIGNKYHVTAYPTLMWLDGDGKLLHMAVGYIEADKLLLEAITVFDKDKRVGSAIEEWNNGNHSLEVARKYFAFNKNSKGEFDEFFNGLTEEQKLDSLTFIMITKIQPDLNGNAWKFIVRHRNDYNKIMYPLVFFVTRGIDDKIDKDLMDNFGTEKYEATLKKYKKTGFDELPLFVKRAEWKYYLKKSDFKAFEKAANEYVKTFAESHSSAYTELIFALATTTDYKKFREAANNPKIVLDWMKKNKKIRGESDSFDYMEVFAYIIVGDNESAKKVCNDYLKKTEGKTDSMSESDRDSITGILNAIKEEEKEK